MQCTPPAWLKVQMSICWPRDVLARRLARRWHPDKVKEEEHEEAGMLCCHPRHAGRDALKCERGGLGNRYPDIAFESKSAVSMSNEIEMMG